MRVSWKEYDTISVTDGIARGYTYFAQSIRSVLLPRIDNSSTVPVMLHAIPAHLFEPEPDRFNVLFSMWESPELPSNFIEASRKADQIIVPSEFCRRVWKKAGFHAEVVPLGIEPELLQLERNESPERIRFLFVGSRITRKGWHLVPEAFSRAFRHSGGDVELYVKMISNDFKGVAQPKPWMTIDGRDLSRQELYGLYAGAHVFVFPSLGEGFGLPALEAMAAGCLVVSTDIGGLKDFVDDETAIVIKRSQIADLKYSDRYRARIPTVKNLTSALIGARSHWGSPGLEGRRRRARERASSYTWDRTAHELMTVVEDAYEAAA